MPRKLIVLVPWLVPGVGDYECAVRGLFHWYDIVVLVRCQTFVCVARPGWFVLYRDEGLWLLL